jgi:hypothetical protein
MHGVEDAVHVDVDAAVPGRRVGERDRAEGGDAGVGPDHVEPAMAFEGSGHGGGLCHVSHHRQHLAAAVCRGAAQRLGIAVHQHRQRAAPMQLHRGGRADAGRGAGDEDHLAAQ